MLRRGGHQVGLFLAGGDLEGALDRVAAFRPDAVAFSVLSGSHQRYYAIARRAKQRLGVPTLWGGPHPDLLPRDDRSALGRRGVRRRGGGGRPAFRATASTVGRAVADGRARTSSSSATACATPTRRCRAIARSTICRIPPATSISTSSRSSATTASSTSWRTGAVRTSCTYCFNAGYNALYREQGDHAIFRSRSPGLDRRRDPGDEGAGAAADGRLRRRRVHAAQGWTLEFAEVYARRCRIPFSVNARFDNLDDETVAALRSAACTSCTRASSPGTSASATA